MHRLALHRWQARQNPRKIVHGGRELRCLRLIRSEQPNHTRIQRLMSLPADTLTPPDELSGLVRFGATPAERSAETRAVVGRAPPPACGGTNGRSRRANPTFMAAGASC